MFNGTGPIYLLIACEWIETNTIYYDLVFVLVETVLLLLYSVYATSTTLYAHSLLFQHEHAIHCYTYAKPNSQNTSHTKCVSFSVRLQYVHSSGLTSWHNHFSVVNNIPSLRIVVPSRLYLFILYSIFSFNIFFSSASSSSRTQNLINIRLSRLA